MSRPRPLSPAPLPTLRLFGDGAAGGPGFGPFADALAVLLFACSGDGRTACVNRAWLDFTGLSDATSLARHWSDVTVPGDACPLVFPAHADDAPTCETRFRLRDAAGRFHWHVARARRTTDVDGVAWWVGTAQAAAPRTELDAMALDRDAFLALVSHELRSPLNAIRGWAHVLRKAGGLAPAQCKPLDAIERNVATQARLIDDLLDSRRLLKGEVALERSRVALHELIADSVEGVQPAASERGQSIVTHPVADDAAVDGDADRLRQVMVNLLSNAVKFTPPGGRIEVRGDARDGRATIAVSDSGIGLTADWARQAFEPFRQGAGADDARPSGLGLGLTLARRLVELHGGTLQATSDGPGKGSTFIIELPAAAATAQGPRVLVLEDDDETRALLEVLMREQGFEPMAFGDPRAAFEHLTQLPTADSPRLIVSDIGLPGEDGYSFIRRVHAMHADRNELAPPALALTAQVGREARARALDAGFDDHLGKPVDPEALRTSLERLLQSRPPRTDP